jgi:DNA invertase Pin-like site-specific DNA recombinase
VALYRISDDRKQDSIPTQKAFAARVCQRDRLSMVNEFEDSGVSGSDVLRPALDQLLAFVRKRFYDRQPVRYLLLVDLDRFGRRDSFSTSAWLESLRKYGLRYVVTTAQRYDLRNQLDRTLINLSSDFTREPELRAKSNHTLNGMVEKARLGLWMGGRPPFGYRIGADGHLTPGPEEEVEILKWIFATYASGRLSATGVARALNERGVRPPRSKTGRWCQRTILGLLCNRAYLGCTAWGGQPFGKYHRIDKGFVVPREDKEDREEQQLLRGLKSLPTGRAGDEDLIFCPNAHTALVDRATFDACATQREKNKEDFSRPREYRTDENGEKIPAGEPRRKGEVWPLAGQIKCGHCGWPVWVLPQVGGGEPTGRVRVRLACSNKRKNGPDACPNSGQVRYLDAVRRVVNLVRKKLTCPGMAEEWLKFVEVACGTWQETRAADRQRLEAKVADLDRQVGDATCALLKFPDDLKADGFEQLRGLKARRDAAAQELRDLDAAARDDPLDPAQLRLLLETVGREFYVPDSWETREEAEEIRQTLRDVVGEVRFYWRPRTAADKLPRSLSAVKNLLRRVEVDLTPCFADLAASGTGPASPASGPAPAGWFRNRGN